MTTGSCYGSGNWSNKEKENVKQYTHVGVCQSAVDKEDDVQIMVLQSCGSDNILFKPVENVVSFVKYSKIRAKPPTANINMKGNRVYYEFHTKINVWEKRI